VIVSVVHFRDRLLDVVQCVGVDPAFACMNEQNFLRLAAFSVVEAGRPAPTNEPVAHKRGNPACLLIGSTGLVVQQELLM